MDIKESVRGAHFQPYQHKGTREMNKRELKRLTYVYALQAKSEELDELKDWLQERGLWSQYRRSQAGVRNVVQKLLEETCPKQYQYFTDIRDKYHVKVEPKPVMFASNSDTVVTWEDMCLLTNLAAKAKCTMCLREGREVKRCPLRKVLLKHAPPEEIKKDGLCEFACVIPDGIDDI